MIGAADVLPYVDADLKKIAARVVEKAKEFCLSKSVFIIIFLLPANFPVLICSVYDRTHEIEIIFLV